MSRRRLLLLLAAGTAAGLLAGWLRPLPDPASASGRDAGAWSLPPAAALERSTAAQFAAAQGLRWVGDGGAVGATEGATAWTLHGVLPSEQAVLIQGEPDAAVRRIGAGDTLPDGSRLLAVERDAAVLERDGCRIRRELYPRPDQDDTSDDSACIAAESEQDTPPP